MTGPDQAFLTQREADTLVIVPQGNTHDFRYDKLHHEYNELHRVLGGPDIKNMVVDLGDVQFLGSIMIGVIIRLSKTVGNNDGRIVICNASDQMTEILKVQNLLELWPQFPSRESALGSLTA